jgi:multiple sugar transport system permease protein
VIGKFDHRRVAVLLLLGPCLLYMIAFAIYPLIYSLRLSLTDLRAADAAGHWIGLRNYGDLLRDEFFWNATKNSAIMVVSTVTIEVVVGVALAMFFNLHLRGSAIVRGILVLPMLITPIVVGVMWRSLLNPDWGLINWVIVELGFEQPNWLGSVEMAMKTLILVDAWQWTPFVFVIVYARLQTLPHEVIEAAQIDGASRYGVFRHITLPLLMPAIVFAAVFRAVDAFRSFDLIFGLTYGGPARSTTTLAFFAFQNGFHFQNYGYAAAVSYMMLLILMIGTTVLLRYVTLRPEYAQ